MILRNYNRCQSTPVNAWRPDGSNIDSMPHQFFDVTEVGDYNFNH